MKNPLFIILCLLITIQSVYGQSEKEPIQFDDIQVDIKKVELNKNSDTLDIELFLISLDKKPREFRLNVFATQILNEKGKSNFLSTIHIGRVLIRLEDKLNYLNYLLQPDTPVLLNIKVANWSKNNPTEYDKLKLVFEDGAEEGKFNEFYLNLQDLN